MDDMNVRCDSITLDTVQTWPFDPAPCPAAAASGSVILHLWAMKIYLYITHHRFVYYYVVHREESSAKDIRVATIRLSPTATTKFCDSQRQGFVILNRRIMLVERHGKFYERQALGTLFCDESMQHLEGRSKTTAYYIKKLGVFEHVELR